jgi:hypothetical protein
LAVRRGFGARPRFLGGESPVSRFTFFLAAGAGGAASFLLLAPLTGVVKFFSAPTPSVVSKQVRCHVQIWEILKTQSPVYRLNVSIIQCDINDTVQQ